jgi:hypothetical protein
MQRRSIVAMVSAMLAGLGWRRAAGQMGPGMGPGMMGGGSMMAHGNMMGPMMTGMQLFERHAEIIRATDYLPNGIIDTTVSDTPRTARLIQAHVVEMYRRLDENRPFAYPASPSVGVMFAHPTAYQRSYRLLPTGIEVTETSDDPAMVKVIYAHARELDGFTKNGMPAMMRGMMRGTALPG